MKPRTLGQGEAAVPGLVLAQDVRDASGRITLAKVALQALGLAGAQLAKNGVPAHPGTLLWLAWLSAPAGLVPIIGMPSCGLFSKATMFDLILPRLLTGEQLGKRELAAYGDGGLLSKDALFRFSPLPPAGPARRARRVSC